MSKGKTLVKNTIIVAIGKICTQFISFFLLPLYTAFLSADEYGTVDLLNTYVSLLIPLIFLQLDQALFRFLIDARKDESSRKTLISTTLLVVVVQSVIYLIFYILIGKYINNQYKYFLATNVVATMFSNIFLQISRGLGDNTTYSMGSIVSGAGTVILNVLLIAVFKFGAYGMLISNLIANILCSIFIFMKLKIYKYISIKKFSKKSLKSLLKYSVPLVPNQLSWWIISVSDRTIITYFLGVAMNGIYSVANKFSSICISFFGIFNLTWTEFAAVNINEKNEKNFFSDIINKALRIFIPLCLGTIAYMPFVFDFLITGQDYKFAYYQIPILMLSTIFNIIVSLISSIYIALKKSKDIAKTTIYSAIINIVINLLLVKYIGLYAASISTLIAYLSMTIYRYFDVQKYVKINIDKKFIFYSFIVSIIIIPIYYYRNIYICILGASLITLYALISVRSMVKEIITFMEVKIKNLKSSI